MTSSKMPTPIVLRLLVAALLVTPSLLVMPASLRAAAPEIPVDELLGGCQAEARDLAEEDARRADEILGVGRELEALGRLQAFLAEDPGRKNRARPQIQAILRQALRFHEIPARSGSPDDLEAAGRLVRLYTEDSSTYPEYSYEAALLREIQFILVETAQKLEIASIEDSEARMEAAPAVARKYNPLRVAAMRKGLSDLWERTLDPCARARLWRYVHRLVGGQKYFLTGQGLENDEPTVTQLVQVYIGEGNPAVQEIATPAYEALLGE